jgi:hypothetical protein
MAIEPRPECAHGRQCQPPTLENRAAWHGHSAAWWLVPAGSTGPPKPQGCATAPLHHITSSSAGRPPTLAPPQPHPAPGALELCEQVRRSLDSPQLRGLAGLRGLPPRLDATADAVRGMLSAEFLSALADASLPAAVGAAAAAELALAQERQRGEGPRRGARRPGAGPVTGPGAGRPLAGAHTAPRSIPRP